MILGTGHPALAAPEEATQKADEGKTDDGIFAQDNLVAWCIVPFDAKHRGPKERVEMLNRLGIKRMAYDWRGSDVPMFEEEILQYKKHGIEYLAFWGFHPNMVPLIKKYGIKPQFWKTIGNPGKATQEENVDAAAKALLPLVKQTKDIGCQLAIYNHGGWAGEPANMVAVCERIREMGDNDHVGLVYNLHHGHGHIKDFAQVLDLMKPYLFCLNLNGMNDGARPKILPIGQGQHDKEMLQIILDSGYQGPIGILDHRARVDAEESLRQNLDGLRKVVKELKPKASQS